jgi:hypothetical protein
MQRLRNLFTSDDGQGLSNLTLILVLVAIVVFAAFLFVGGETSPAYRGVGELGLTVCLARGVLGGRRGPLLVSGR